MYHKSIWFTRSCPIQSWQNACHVSLRTLLIQKVYPIQICNSAKCSMILPSANTSRHFASYTEAWIQFIWCVCPRCLIYFSWFLQLIQNSLHNLEHYGHKNIRPLCCDNCTAWAWFTSRQEQTFTNTPKWIIYIQVYVIFEKFCIFIKSWSSYDFACAEITL